MFVIIGVMIGFVFGWQGREMYAKYILEKISKHALQPIFNTNTHKDILNVEVIKDGNDFLIYDSKSGAFIVQVKSKKELSEYFTNKYNDKTIMMTKEHCRLFEE